MSGSGTKNYIYFKRTIAGARLFQRIQWTFRMYAYLLQNIIINKKKKHIYKLCWTQLCSCALLRRKIIISIFEPWNHRGPIIIIRMILSICIPWIYFIQSLFPCTYLYINNIITLSLYRFEKCLHSGKSLWASLTRNYCPDIESIMLYSVYIYASMFNQNSIL